MNIGDRYARGALALFVALGIVLAECGATARADERPNVVIVLVDDFGWSDPSCYGNPLAKTPQIDRMASEGIRFTQGYVAAPICSPSRCGLITGQFPARWKITSYLQTKEGNRASEMADYLDPGAPSLPRILQQAGYATAHIGKWHLGGGRDVDNAPKFSAYGYDFAVGTWESPEPHPDITSTDWVWAETDAIKRHDRTRWMVDHALEFIESHDTQPCFVNLWLDDTHRPFVPSEEQLAQVSHGKGKPMQKKYKAVLAELDRQVGRLLDALKGTNTLVLLIGDNGAFPTFRQARVGQLRGSKLSLYEGGVRVPFIAWWARPVSPGAVNEATVIATVDLVPSLAHLCGAALPADYEPDGEDLSGALVGKSPERTKALFWEYGRNDTFSYPPEARNRSPNVGIREGKWKLLVNDDGSGTELYDIASDPKETTNVADDHPEIAQRLSEAALKWRKSMP